MRYRATGVPPVRTFMGKMPMPPQASANVQDKPVRNSKICWDDTTLPPRPPAGLLLSEVERPLECCHLLRVTPVVAPQVEIVGRAIASDSSEPPVAILAIRDPSPVEIAE